MSLPEGEAGVPAWVPEAGLPASIRHLGPTTSETCETPGPKPAYITHPRPDMQEPAPRHTASAPPAPSTRPRPLARLSDQPAPLRPRHTNRDVRDLATDTELPKSKKNKFLATKAPRTIRRHKTERDRPLDPRIEDTWQTRVATRPRGQGRALEGGRGRLDTTSWQPQACRQLPSQHLRRHRAALWDPRQVSLE